VPTVLKSGSLDFLEPSGNVQACIEIALHLLSRGWNWAFVVRCRQLTAVSLKIHVF